MGRLPHVVALHGCGESAASAAKCGKQTEGDHDVLVQLLLLDALLPVLVEAAVPADDGAGQAHAENHDGHHGGVAVLDEGRRHVERLKGAGDFLEEGRVFRQKEGGGGDGGHRVHEHRRACGGASGMAAGGARGALDGG